MLPYNYFHSFFNLNELIIKTVASVWGTAKLRALVPAISVSHRTVKGPSADNNSVWTAIEY